MRKSFLSFFGVFAPITLLVVIGLYSAYLYEKKRLVSELKPPQMVLIGGVKTYVETRLSELVDDLELLAAQAPLLEYLESGDPLLLNHVEQFVLNAMRRRKVYDDVRLVSLHGREQIRIRWQGGVPVSVEKDALEDLMPSYYLDQARRYPAGEVFVSSLKTESNGEDTDSFTGRMKLRLSIKLEGRDDRGAILVFDVGEKLLSDFSYLSEGMQSSVLVLNQEGFLFYASNAEHEWPNFPKDYVAFYNMDMGTLGVQSSLDSSQVWREGELWTYSTLTLPHFERWKVLTLLKKTVVERRFELLAERFTLTAFFAVLLGGVLSFVYSRAALRAEKLAHDNDRFVAQVSETEHLLSLFITHVPAAVAMVDRDMRYIAVSNRWLEDFRLVDDVIGKSHNEVFSLAPAYWKSVYQRCFEGAVEYCDEEKLKHADGTVDWVRWEVRPWYTAKNEIGGLVMLMELITTRKQAEAARDEFVAKVSHELRTPLTSIMGGMKLLQANVFGELAPQASEILGIAERNSQRLLNLVNDLLDMQKIRLGEMEFDLENVSIKSVVDDSVNAVMEKAKDKNIPLVIVDESLGAKVHVDEKRLSQVTENLLLNAIKHTPADGQITIKIARLYDEVMVSVSDSGPGVPEALKRHIFEDFAQDEEGDVRTPGGTGLGLAIAKSLLERFGGSISFYNLSDGEGGAVFYYTLPEVAKGGA